jgi:RND family efflux transporter MFP subunit
VSNQLSRDLASLRIQRDAPRSKGRWGAVLLALGIAGALGAGYVYGRPAIESRLFKAEVVATEIGSISPAQASIDLTSTGYVVPQKTAKVGSNVIARIMTANASEGQTVHAGEVLYELDHLTQDAAVASSRARAASARARVASAKAAESEARLPWEREKKLVALGASPAATAEDLGARVTSLNEQVNAAQAEATAADAEVHALEAQLPQYTIKAPIDGVIQAKPAQLGEVADPAMPLAEIVDASTLLVETDVPEGRLHLVKVGQPCEVVLDSAAEQRFRGRVEEIGPRVNRTKSTGLVKVRLVDMPPLLTPDMSARVSFLAKELDQADMKAPPKTIVPTSAIVDRGGSKAVFVLADGKVKLAPVKLGDALEGGFVLLEGPPPGTRVVKDPSGALRDGQAVKEASKEGSS